MNLAIIAKHYRLNNKLDQKTMAIKIGCSHAAYCQFEAGKQQPKLRNVLSILKLTLPNFEQTFALQEVEAELYLTKRGPRGKIKV